MSELKVLNDSSHEIEAIGALDDLWFHLNRVGFLCGVSGRALL